MRVSRRLVQSRPNPRRRSSSRTWNTPPVVSTLARRTTGPAGESVLDRDYRDRGGRDQLLGVDWQSIAALVIGARPTDFLIEPMSQTRGGESGSWFGMAPNEAKALATALAISPPTATEGRDTPGSFSARV